MAIKNFKNQSPAWRLILLFMLLQFTACQPTEEKTWGDISFSSPVKIIFDTDMLTDCDDAAALAILHKLADTGEADILATMVTSSYPMSAPVVEAINTYYNRPDIPIGVPKNGLGVYRSNSSFLDSVALEFPHKLRSNDDAPDAVALYRQLLSKEKNNSVVIVTLGYMSNLKPLLESKADNYSSLNGVELVKQKVKIWICMGGNFPVDDASDNVNFTRDSVAAVYALTHWPGEIVFAGREIGHNIHVGDRLKETPFDNPVRRAYQLHRERAKKGHWNHHTADPSAVMLAVRGLADYWTTSEKGYVEIKEDCSFIWTPHPKGNQRYIIQKKDRKELGEIMENLMILPPEGYTPRQRVILDTDIDSDVDDVGALAMLYNLHNQQKINLMGVIVTSDDPYAPTCVSALNSYYGLENLPIGFLENQSQLKNHSRYTRRLSEEYPHNLTSWEEAETATNTYRKLLTESPDNSVIIITIGHLSSLHKLLESKPDAYSPLTGKELVDAKVMKWYCMGGQFPEGKEANFYRPDPISTVYCLANWDKEVVFCGWEVGNKIITGGNDVKTSLPESHPVYRAYQLYNDFAGRASWDQLAVWLLTEQALDFFEIDYNGICKVEPDGSNQWIAGEKSNQGFLKLKNEGDIQIISSLISQLIIGK